MVSKMSLSLLAPLGQLIDVTLPVQGERRTVRAPNPRPPDVSLSKVQPYIRHLQVLLTYFIRPITSPPSCLIPNPPLHPWMTSPQAGFSSTILTQTIRSGYVPQNRSITNRRDSPVLRSILRQTLLDQYGYTHTRTSSS